jgi:hypothetical protein
METGKLKSLEQFRLCRLENSRQPMSLRPFLLKSIYCTTPFSRLWRKWPKFPKEGETIPWSRKREYGNSVCRSSSLVLIYGPRPITVELHDPCKHKYKLENSCIMNKMLTGISRSWWWWWWGGANISRIWWSLVYLCSSFAGTVQTTNSHISCVKS